MSTKAEDIDYKVHLDKALLIMEGQAQTIQNLQLQLLQLKKLMYGSSHEKFMGTGHPTAPTLFNVASIAESVVISSTPVSYERKTTQLQSNHKGRNPFPDTLRRVEQILNPEGLDIEKANKIGEDVTEILAFQPGELFVKKIVRPRYLDPLTNRIYQAPAPARSFERSNVDSSLVAQVVVEKYVDHLPLYRQLKRYERLGVQISDSTMGHWVAAAAQL